jgi:hypothetical protein
MKKYLGITLLVTLTALVVSSCFTGCGTAPTLDPAGAYAGQPELFAIDTTLADSKDALTSFLTWESDNHEKVLGTWAGVTQAADAIRTNAPAWFTNAYNFRASYVALRAALQPDPARLAAASNAYAAEVLMISARASVVTNLSAQAGP